MVGGRPEAIAIIQPRVGDAGPVQSMAGRMSAHLVQATSSKMIHNGIEYGTMRAYAGEILRAKHEFA